MNDFFKKLTSKPKKLFLIDGIGAFITALLLFTILRPYSENIGLPPKTLIILSIVAIVFSLYSLSCFVILTTKWKPFLRAIAMGNLLYCALTISLILYLHENVTALGLAYFLVEVMIIGGLAYVELKAS